MLHTQKQTCEKLRKLQLVCTVLKDQSGGWSVPLHVTNLISMHYLEK